MRIGCPTDARSFGVGVSCVVESQSRACSKSPKALTFQPCRVLTKAKSRARLCGSELYRIARRSLLVKPTSGNVFTSSSKSDVVNTGFGPGCSALKSIKALSMPRFWHPAANVAKASLLAARSNLPLGPTRINSAARISSICNGMVLTVVALLTMNLASWRSKHRAKGQNHVFTAQEKASRFELQG